MCRVIVVMLVWAGWNVFRNTSPVWDVMVGMLEWMEMEMRSEVRLVLAVAGAWKV